MPVPVPEAVDAPASDESLMLAAARGDAGAFSTLARRHAAHLVMYCVQFTRSMAAAEEVAQEV